MDDILQKLKQKELEILKETTKVCDQLGLKYALFYGTLIGAIRHQGFIPWDDDIDIIMPREDYDLFLEKAQQYLPSNLFVQHYTTEKENNNIFIKIRDKKTLFLENESQEFDICHGVFIDIFPMEQCKKEEEQAEFKRRAVFHKLMDCYSVENIKTIQNRWKRFGAKVIHYTFCKWKTMNQRIEKEDLRRKSVHQKGGDCYLLDNYSYAGSATYEELFDVVPMQFEGEMFSCPKAYDSLLTRAYGAYMTIPPENERITHKPLRIEL